MRLRDPELDRGEPRCPVKELELQGPLNFSFGFKEGWLPNGSKSEMVIYRIGSIFPSSLTKMKLQTYAYRTGKETTE